jgi:uncharacterized protein YdeI (YjbR/CyaY-like superfamily)
MSALDEASYVHADDAATWRTWLQEHHADTSGCWLVTWRAHSGHPSLSYEQAIEEATCFGWVDSTAGKFDDNRGKLYFSPRRTRSPWAATNKERVARLTAQGRMAPAGLAAVAAAKANGYWEILDPVERLEIPDDLADALERRPPAHENFTAFPPSARKQMLAWVVLARRPETRAARIDKIVAAAERNERVRG